MKKVLCLVLAMLFVLPLAACASTSPLPGLNNDIGGNADEIAQLEQELEDLKEEYDKKLKDLKNKISALENDKIKKDNEIKALKEEINQLKALYDERISALEKLIEETNSAPMEESTSTPEEDSTPAIEVEDTSEVTTDPTICPPQPNASLGGYNYKALVCASPRLYCEDFWVEQAGEDALSYAVYVRNTEIEDIYDCYIRQFSVKNEDMYSEMVRLYNNSEPYELAIVPAMCAVNCAMSNLFVDVYSLDQIDLDHESYDQNFISEFTLGGKLYFIGGDMNISPLDSAAVTIFNPDLFDKYDFTVECNNESYDSIYEMVQEGTWTVSAMMEMAEVVNIDAAGDDGTLSAIEQGDQVGYFAYSASPMYYWYGCGARVARLDNNSSPMLVFGAEDGNSEEMYNFLFYLFNNQQPGKDWIPNGGNSARNNEFLTDQLLFTDATLREIRRTIHVKDTARYGILPTPKYTEDQARYFDLVYFPDNTVLFWAVPTMINNLDYASFMLNIIADYSSTFDGTMEAYFVKTLELSVARDAGSRTSLRIIRDSLAYDIFLICDWGNFITDLIVGLDTAVYYEYDAKTTDSKLDDALDDIESTLEKFRTPVDPIRSDAQ